MLAHYGVSMGPKPAGGWQLPWPGQKKMPHWVVSSASETPLERWRAAALVAAVALAFFIPRLATLGGIELSASLSSGDQPFHQHQVDLLVKRLTLEDGPGDMAYFAKFPLMKAPPRPLRWPPGVYGVAAPFALLFGSYSVWTTQCTNAVFTVVLLLAVFLLGRVLGGARVGLWAALLTVLCPALVASTWYLSLDYPLAGMVLMGLYLLWRTRGFTGARATLLFGVWSGLGICVKVNYPLYLLVPSAVALIRALKGGHRREPAMLLPAAAAITLGIAQLALAPDWTTLWRDLGVHAVGRNLPASTIDPWSLEWFLALPRFAASNYPWPLLLLAVPGLVALHLGRRRPAGWLLLSFFWGGLVCLTLMTNKMERYLLPLYPLACVLAAWWLARLPGRWRLAGPGAAAVAHLGLLAYLHLVAPTPWYLQEHDPKKATLGVYYDLTMPGQERLDRLRRLTYHADFDLRPLVRQVLRWARRDRQKLPLGLFYLKRPHSKIMEPPVGAVVLPVAHHLRDRFLVGYLFGLEGIPPALLYAPRLMVIHPEGLDPREGYPEIKVLQRWPFCLSSPEGGGRYELSLLAPAPLPADLDPDDPTPGRRPYVPSPGEDTETAFPAAGHRPGGR